MFKKLKAKKDEDKPIDEQTSYSLVENIKRELRKKDDKEKKKKPKKGLPEY